MTNDLDKEARCDHCGAVLSMPAGMCAECFLNDHRSHPADGRQTLATSCGECQTIQAIQDEPYGELANESEAVVAPA